MVCSIIIILILFYGCYSRNKDKGFSVNQQIGWRGLLCIIIFTDHFSQELNDPGLMKIFSFCGYVIVAIFFTISGYGLTKQYLNRKEDYLSNFFKKRILSILIPFWL